jgi:hypothetical protein
MFETLATCEWLRAAIVQQLLILVAIQVASEYYRRNRFRKWEDK